MIMIFEVLVTFKKVSTYFEKLLRDKKDKLDKLDERSINYEFVNDGKVNADH